MRVLLYMGFTTPPNVFNELKKENTFWYTDQHNKDGKTLTEMPHIRQLLSESRLIDLSDISRKLTKLGRCLFLGGFVQRRQTDGKWTQKTIWTKPRTESRKSSGLFISVYNEESKPDFIEQHWDIQWCQQSNFSLSILAFFVLSVIKQ